MSSSIPAHIANIVSLYRHGRFAAFAQLLRPVNAQDRAAIAQAISGVLVRVSDAQHYLEAILRVALGTHVL